MSGKKLLSGIAWLVVGIVAYPQFVEMQTENQNTQDDQPLEEYKDFDIIFHQDLENTPLGTYDRQQWGEDWNMPDWANGISTGDRTVIDDLNTGGRRSRYMKWIFPKGSYSVNEYHGYQWHTRLGDSYEECYLSFSVMFKPGFEAVQGGKLMGLQGGEKSIGPPLWEEGFGGSLMFKDGPNLAFYIYHQDMPGTWGELRNWNYTFNVSTNTWYDITYRIVMNTATATDIGGPDGLKDGILEGFVNGKLVGQWTGVRLRNLASIGIDVARIQAFFGGSGDEYAAIRDEWILVDNVYVWTYSDNYLRDNPKVKHGRQANAYGDIIYTPFNILFNSEEDLYPNPTESDVQSPTIPTGLRAIDSTSNSIKLTWNIASDNIEVAGYYIFVDDESYDTSVSNTYTVSQLNPATKYSFAVSAFDAESNESPRSTSIVAHTCNLDTISPTAPTNLRVKRVTGYAIDIEWDDAYDESGIEKYGVIINGQEIYATDKTFITIGGLKPDTQYELFVKAYDASGNQGPGSNTIIQKTSQADTESPSIPSGLIETAVTQHTISLRWNPATDNLGVSEYKIYVNNVEGATSTSTEKTLTKLEPGLEYFISVSAVDESRNESPQSSHILVVTKEGDIITPHELPTVSIVQIKDNTINPSIVSEVGSLGFAKVKNYGILVSEVNHPEKEPFVLNGVELTPVMNESRISKNVQLLYNFAEGQGNYVQDHSGNQKSMDLYISKEGSATEWLLGQGLRIFDNTILYCPKNPKRLIDSLVITNEITIEAWVKQEQSEQSGPARIVTLSTDNFNRAITLAHDGNDLFYNYVTRLNTTETDANGTPELKTDHNFTSYSLHHVIFTRNNSGHEKLYINGSELASGYREGDFSSWDENYWFALANEYNNERPWKGIYYLVAVYNRALSENEINQNYQSGLGRIRFANNLDTLKSNVNYSITPFVDTDHGLVYGQTENFLYQTNSDSLLSIYPNPSNGDITITVRKRNEDVMEGHLRLVDFAGGVHFEQDLNLSEAFFEEVFEIQLPVYLKEGIYSLVLIMGSKASAEKLILMR